LDIGSPSLLWLLLAAPALGYWVWREDVARARRRATLGEAGLVSAMTMGEDSVRRRTSRIALVFAWVFLVIGLAGPRVGARTELLPRRGLDVVFAVDVSESMRARDVRPDRLERVKAEISATLNALGENRVGLVAFAGSAFVQCPLTTDVEAMRAFVRALGPDVVPQGGTAVASGLAAAARMFEAEDEAAPVKKAGRVVVVFTDGEDHEGGVEEAAKRLETVGASVIVIGVGSGLGEPIPVVSETGSVVDYLKDKAGNTVMTRMSPETLSAVAQASKGQFVDGTREPDLGMSYLLAEVARLEKRDLEARVRTTFVDRSHWPLGLALVLLVFGLTYPERRRAMTGLESSHRRWEDA